MLLDLAEQQNYSLFIIFLQGPDPLTIYRELIKPAFPAF